MYMNDLFNYYRFYLNQYCNNCLMSGKVMNIKIQKICGFALLFFLSIVLNSCISTFKNIELKKDYDISSKSAISVFVIPTGNKNLDETYSRVFRLNLQALGYKVIDANRILQDHSDNIVTINHRQIADSLLLRKYYPSCDIFAITKPKWDSVFIATTYSEKNNIDGKYITYAGMDVLSLYSEVVLFDFSMIEPIMSFSAIDTIRVYSESDDSELLYPEHDWMMVARQLAKNLNQIDVCKVNNSISTSNKFLVSFWVDKSYREAFSEEWKNRIIRRVVFANDILREQLGIELVISEFIEWNSRFESSLDYTLSSLYMGAAPKPNMLRIGITFDKKLQTNWTDRSTIGLAVPLGVDAIISAQPSFPDLGIWNPLEEAMTIVHEVAHILGAIHVPDEGSIMYPYSGSFSFEFDDLNRKIIQASKFNYFNVDAKKRVTNYIDNLVELRKKESKNSFPILPAIENSVFSLNLGGYSYDNYIDEIHKSFSEVIKDSLHLVATLGLVDYNFGRNEQAKSFFAKALELDPEFAEVHWYLSLGLQKMEEQTLAELHKELAKPYRKLWILEESRIRH